jgi:uncharacterized protein YdeI (YjbR/CyaY-like superfamily)
MKPHFFETGEKFRHWLETNHDKLDELLVGFYKRGSGRPSMTWPESVDAALCFGWIDGIRRRVDEAAYTIRFTPRRRGSIWSAVNIDRVQELIRLGIMHPAGLAAFAKREEKKSRIYSYEREHAAFAPSDEKRFRSNKKAWKFFSAQPPGYRRLVTHWVVSAKKDETRAKRLAKLIDLCERGKRLL